MISFQFFYHFRLRTLKSRLKYCNDNFFILFICLIKTKVGKSLTRNEKLHWFLCYVAPTVSSSLPGNESVIRMNASRDTGTWWTAESSIRGTEHGVWITKRWFSVDPPVMPNLVLRKKQHVCYFVWAYCLANMFVMVCNITVEFY